MLMLSPKEVMIAYVNPEINVERKFKNIRRRAKNFIWDKPT